MGAIVVALIAHTVRFHRYINRHLRPFEEEIVEQLDTRPQTFAWSNVSPQIQQSVDLLIEIIAIEKPLDDLKGRALHPDDPVALLFWGPFDDITVLQFRFQFEKAFGVTISNSLLEDAWENDWTLHEFLQRCVSLTDTSNPVGATFTGL